jgi:hypothetical protein
LDPSAGEFRSGFLSDVLKSKLRVAYGFFSDYLSGIPGNGLLSSAKPTYKFLTLCAGIGTSLTFALDSLLEQRVSMIDTSEGNRCIIQDD